MAHVVAGRGYVLVFTSWYCVRTVYFILCEDALAI